MESSIYPCIWFDGKAQEAAELYCSAFKNSSITSSNPMVVIFEIMGKKFMGLNGGSNYKPNPSISFFTTCTSKEELDAAWNLLIEDGQALMPIDKYPWSNHYGWLQDKYGVSWQLTLGSPEEQQPKPDIFPSLLFTGAQNGKAEAAINFYTSLFENSKVEVISKYQAGEHDIEDHIKFAQFTVDGQRISVMDSSHNHAFTFSPGISLVVNCDTQEQIDYLWLNLTEGGTADRCGWCQDSYGVSWQVVPTILGQLMSDPQKAPKVVEAFMKMTKFDIQALKDAAL
jgi:predicted 3-demethylubiquinone-9 3-methyltransferase (glyoxalase superfamily)